MGIDTSKLTKFCQNISMSVLDVKFKCFSDKKYWNLVIRENSLLVDTTSIKSRYSTIVCNKRQRLLKN